ncbi:primase-helicase family protein [Anatilimnocola floriformis]|uniref:primase-helicase family protein n=1 Tax=Anatilimnocola floriformis TaxID=2948575 RepID=UPI0020C1E994|nr:primase-helicase family protein [Anatilimnocola floriformis]
MTTFDSVCADHGAAPCPKSERGYLFGNVPSAVAACLNLGFTFPAFDLPADRTVLLYVNKHSKLVARPARHKDEPSLLRWITAPRSYEAVLGGLVEDETDHNYDDRYRSCVRRTDSTLLSDDLFRGLVASGDDVHWTKFYASSIRMMLQDEGLTRSEADCAIGRMIRFSWEIVTRPFKPEYPVPGKRIWNPDAPQLKCSPIAGPHPTFDCILSHCGREMDIVLPDNEWAREHSIVTGADWLRILLASIFRQPEMPTPYLFLFGPQNSGKSILHEMLYLLMTKGIVQADRALTNKSDFNGELDGAIVCVVEEKNLTKASGSLAKIKQAVTSPKLSIRKMRTESFMADNLTHWIQTSNDNDGCVVEHGDTRIQTLHVLDLPPGEEIPKPVLLELLKAEAPHFTFTLLNVKLPPPIGRLALEIIDTPSRLRLADSNVCEFAAEVAEFANLQWWPAEAPLQAGSWEQGSWHGNAAELATALKEVQKYPDAPRDGRLVARLLGEHTAYLASRGVTFVIGDKTKRGRIITLSTTNKTST